MHCSVDRLKASAAAYAEANGTDALRSLLLAVAGVSRVEDVPEVERLRVNVELRHRATEAIPIGLAEIGRRAFAKMVRR